VVKAAAGVSGVKLIGVARNGDSPRAKAFHCFAGGRSANVVLSHVL
jgi:hypothetical protein